MGGGGSVGGGVVGTGAAVVTAIVAAVVCCDASVTAVDPATPVMFSKAVKFSDPSSSTVTLPENPVLFPPETAGPISRAAPVTLEFPGDGTAAKKLPATPEVLLVPAIGPAAEAATGAGFPVKL